MVANNNSSCNTTSVNGAQREGEIKATNTTTYMGETVSETRGFIGGVIGGALVSLGLMKMHKVEIKSNKQTIQRQALDPGATVTLLPSTTYRFAIILFHGDGDTQVQLTVKVDGKTYTLSGDEQAIEVIANETVEITATNTDTTSPRNAPTIEIASMWWDT